MAARELPTPETLRKLLRYDPVKGKLFWRRRPAQMFPRKQDAETWNATWAGKEALTANVRGYRQGNIFGRRYRAHRVIWALHYGEWPAEEIDHINGDPADNRLSNLRASSRAENLRNAARRSDNTSGVTGVMWFAPAKRWRAEICVGGRGVHLGYFDDLAEAAAARKVAEAKYGFHVNHGRSKEQSL